MTQRTIAPTDPDLPVEAVLAAADDDDTVFVDDSGEPRAVVISIERLQRLRDAEAEDRRRAALAWLDEYQASYDGRNDDLSDEQIEELADRFSREFVDELVAEGKIAFEDELAR
jgi:hypothetical protein